jgi:hypothetical protein
MHIAYSVFFAYLTGLMGSLVFNFSAVFIKIIKRFIKRGYDQINLRHTACLVFHPVTV